MRTLTHTEGENLNEAFYKGWAYILNDKRNREADICFELSKGGEWITCIWGE